MERYSVKDQVCETPQSLTRNPVVDRLRLLVPLDADDADRLTAVQTGEMTLRPGDDMIGAGHSMDSVFFVADGWLMRQVLLEDGRRQGLGMTLPGDILGGTQHHLSDTRHSITALTDVTLTTVAPDAYGDLLCDAGRLGRALALNVGRARALLEDHILRLGRLSALERTCHLMLELTCRAAEVGHVEDGWVRWPLKQSDMADLLGLSLVHVNRTVMQLKREGLITLEQRRLRLDDAARLSEISGYDPEASRPKAA